MKTKLIIVSDLGHLRIFREVPPKGDFGAHLELIEEMTPAGAQVKFSAQVSDKAGRFSGRSGSGVSGDVSAGEKLNHQAEHNRRLMGELVEKINQRLKEPGVDSCLFAASAPIHRQLLGALEPPARKKITQVLASNLSKTDARDILRHFAARAP